jgi:hypothetical protein
MAQYERITHMSSTVITTNRMAHAKGAAEERQRTIYAITAHIASIQDRLKNTQSDLVRQAFVLAIIELNELQKTLEKS